MVYNKELIKNALKKKGYVWFDDEKNKNYDVNIVGIRKSVPGNKVTNIFDDILCVSFKLNGKWLYYEWAVTVDPGRKSVLEFSNRDGVAILVPSQYRGAYHVGLHRGQYKALVQAKPVKVFRDRNKDLKFDMDPKTIQEGLFGINIHRSNPKTESVVVENWSAGCTVFKRAKDFNEFMSIINESRRIHGEFFTYTLINTVDI